MYHYIEDKTFLKKMRGVCSNMINQLVQSINNDSVMTVETHLVGSGARNLETQNEKEPIDLDYNINIVNVLSIKINDGKKIKEYIQKMFDNVLKHNNLACCDDSKSVLSTKLMHLNDYKEIKFKIDLAIVSEDNKSSWYRLIHKKTGIIQNDEWFWNQGPDSNKLTSKANFIKNNNFWDEVRITYLKRKNMYLTKNDDNHSSFNCYIEAINEIYKKHGGK